jgi:hypothetical protein
MRRPFLFIVVPALSLVALMWGYGAFEPCRLSVLDHRKIGKSRSYRSI